MSASELLVASGINYLLLSATDASIMSSTSILLTPQFQRLSHQQPRRCLRLPPPWSAQQRPGVHFVIARRDKARPHGLRYRISNRKRRPRRSLFDNFRSRDNIRQVLSQVYSNQDAVDDDLIDLIYVPSEDKGALETFVSIITGPPGPR